MSSTAPYSSDPPIVTLNIDAQWDQTQTSIREDLTVVAISFGLYGIFVLLCIASIYSLIQLNSRNRPTALILTLALLALFSSTSIYAVAVFVGQLTDILDRALWVVVLAWQIVRYLPDTFRETGDISSDIFDVFMNSALVPLIAIYPTVIIVVVALNRSHIENGFKTPSLDSAYRLPLRPLAIAANTTVTTHCDSQSRLESGGVLVIGQQDFEPEDRPEGSSTHSAEEQKLQNIA